MTGPRRDRCSSLRALGAAALVALGLLAFAPAARAGDGPVTNAVCPVMEGEAVDAEISLQHDGETVYFCCARCRRMFEADPARYLSQLPQFAAKLASLQPEAPKDQPATDAGAAPEPSASDAAPADADPAANPDDPMQEPGSGRRWSVAPPVVKQFDLQEYAGRFHVVAVHFPIALLVVAALLDLFRPRRSPEASGYEAAVRVMVAWGACFAMLAMVLGLINQRGEALEQMDDWTIHKHEGLGIAATGAALWAWGMTGFRRDLPTGVMARLTTPVLLLAAVAIGVAAHFGGSIVWGWNYFIP